MTSMAPDNPTTGSNGRGRLLVAVLIGLAGSLIICIVTPYNNFIMNNMMDIAGTSLPAVALVLFFPLILLVNPLLRRLAPSLALTGNQLAIILGMMLVACVVPSQGVLKWLGYMIVQVPLEVSRNHRLAKVFSEMGLPASLWPDPIGFGAQTPVSLSFLTPLAQGASVPWHAWLPPLLAWGSLLVPCWLMMISLALIVFPEWRRNERLAFPLLMIQQSLVEAPEPGRLLPPILRNRTFWIGAGAVFVLHLMGGLARYFPDSIPAVPLEWNLAPMFAEDPLRYLPWCVQWGRLYFIFVGVAFFMPSRVGVSLWVFPILYALYIMFVSAYQPPFRWDTIQDHRWGASVVFVASILWLGRDHWRRVFGTLVRPVATEEDRRHRKAALMFLAGCAGMILWLLWAGATPGWAVYFVVFGVLTCLLITRLVCETGVPFLMVGWGNEIMFVKLAQVSAMKWFGASLLTPAVTYLMNIVAILFEGGSRMSGTVMAIHAFGLTEKAPPRRQPPYALILVGLMIVALVVAGAVNVYGNYHSATPINTRPQIAWGLGLLGRANSDVVALQSGTLSPPMYNQYGHIAFGAILCLVLMVACLKTPHWPLHPIGLVLVESFPLDTAWWSIFVGWLAKGMVLRYGGAGLYRAARPLFISLILGEVMAAVFWSIVAWILAAMGRESIGLWIQPPY